jgi:DNA-binding CsgD family transcriptional regulator
VLVEREREIAFLDRVIDAVASGPSQLVVLTGEAGAGKSRLAHEVVAGLADDWSVVRLVVESGVPMPAGGRHEPDGRLAVDPTTAIVAAISAELPTRRSSSPTVVVIEDAERLDPAGIAALGTATEALEGDHILVISQVRLGVHPPTSDPAGALAELLRKPFAHEVSLGPLTKAGLGAMAEALGRPLDGDAAAALHARTAGNPFFSEEVLLADHRSLPWTVTDAVMRRLTVLPTGARAAANVLAIAADPVPRAVLDDVVDDLPGVPILLDAGIAGEDEAGEVSLRHALVGEVVAARLGGAERRRLNELLAVRLSRHGVAPERLARHWRDAGDPAKAAQQAIVAADRAAACGAHRTAAELYRLGLTDLPDDPVRRAEVLERAAATAGWAGLSQEAVEWAAAAAAAYESAGEPSRAVAVWLNPGLNLVPKPALDRDLLAEDDIERVLEDARAATHERRHEASAELARRALQMATTTTDGGHWSVRAGRRLIGAGHLAEGEEQLRRVQAMAAAAGDEALLANVLGQLAINAMLRNDLDESLALQRQAMVTARAGQETSVRTHEVGMALVLAYRGDLNDAMAWIDRLLALHSPLITEFVQLPASVVDLERGELDAAAERLDRMAPVTALRIDEYTAGVLLGRARWALESGDARRALATLEEADDAASELIETSLIDRLLCQARAAAVLDDDAIIDDVRRRVAQQVELGVGPGAVAAASWVEGLVDDRSGRHREAAGGLVSAAKSWERLGRFTFAADAWTDAALSAQLAGDLAARDHDVAQANNLARARGMVRVLHRLEAVVSGADPSVQPTPLDGLTAREREIVELVALGRTNREVGQLLFISEHTVRNQLVRIFDKLGVSRRTELAHLVGLARVDRNTS